jgi:short-subunit dehydrogenase involved in D-alanine esterification of teichoic acids
MNEEWAKSASKESEKYASDGDYQTSTFAMNVQDAESVEAMVSFVVEQYGRLDYCVNAAGVSEHADLILAQHCQSRKSNSNRFWYRRSFISYRSADELRAVV